MVKYILKKFYTDQANVDYDATNLGSMRPSTMTLQQFADDIVAKSFKVADVYGESTFNDILIEGVDSSIRHSLRKY